MNILIIDGQGGGIGAQLVSALLPAAPGCKITVVGTNSAATAAMIKAGAKHAATGENAVTVCCRQADIIVGPIGIVIADSLLGEITPKMACAVGQSRARRVLIPISQCGNTIAGVGALPAARLVQAATELVKEMCKV